MKRLLKHIIQTVFLPAGTRPLQREQLIDIIQVKNAFINFEQTAQTCC